MPIAFFRNGSGCHWCDADLFAVVEHLLAVARDGTAAVISNRLSFCGAVRLLGRAAHRGRGRPAVPADDPSRFGFHHGGFSSMSLPVQAHAGFEAERSRAPSPPNHPCGFPASSSASHTFAAIAGLTILRAILTVIASARHGAADAGDFSRARTKVYLMAGRSIAVSVCRMSCAFVPGQQSARSDRSS